MSRIASSLMAASVVVFLLAGSAEAKWWVFGKSESPVDLAYLYLNGISFEEKDAMITLYRDMLPDGMIFVRGKGKSKAKVGAVRVSLDGKKTWRKAKVAAGGAFEFSFKPEVEKPYELFVEVTETTGKINNVDSTRKRVTVSERNIMAEVKEALDRLVQAYQGKDANKFMAGVSREFAADYTVLDRAIRKDFNAFDNITLRLTVSSLASDPKGKVAASVAYSRSLSARKDGKPYQDRGVTEFVFQGEDGKLKVFSMKNPLIFGLSDAGNVGTGMVVISGNQQTIVVDQNGNVQLKPLDEVVQIIEGKTEEATEVRIIEITGQKHHQIILEIDFGVSSLSGLKMVLEESESPGGPWNTAATCPAASPYTITTEWVAQKAVRLYYRVRLVKGNDRSDWSNVAAWDNR